MLENLELIPDDQFQQLFSPRPGEYKLGQKVGLLDDVAKLQDAGDKGYRYALLGVPEDIGPRGNLGIGGADSGWQAFLKYFLNLQSNRYLSGDDIVILGQVKCRDLHKDHDVTSLRQQCEILDERVSSTLNAVFSAGLIPVIIGGGHNNAYPIIKACSMVREMPLAVCNLDPHADFRQQEGRHSGNPFRYAFSDGYLKRYAILGLHEQKNSEEALSALDKEGFPFYSVQQTHWRREVSFDQCLEDIEKYLLNSGFPIGAELDMDVITNMPTSAITRCGVSLQDCLYYVEQLARLPEIQYLHLAEGAPQRHIESSEAGVRIVGQALAELVSAFIKSNQAVFNAE